jgi:hypothetical protein
MFWYAGGLLIQHALKTSVAVFLLVTKVDSSVAVSWESSSCVGAGCSLV